ncbi:MAG: hypothetical protein JXM74_04630 [Fusobacteriaceae bacterium]|nr:hypothetical protein [Fusobacteriaceae bacterium]MBN2838021.1 hypothetical protein [Fusobacteriaceae bacterium]
MMKKTEKSIREEKIRIKRILKKLNPNGKKYEEYLYALALLMNIKKLLRKMEKTSPSTKQN